ncbi:uncharacterized protein TNCV_3030251 [Trichonephila clavipes]|nr:uncharacterized protein TNCV_3030251 [Trichonephila clavipes]
MYPDVTSFDKLNLSQCDWMETEEFEMQLIDFQSSSIWIKKLIETRKMSELIETVPCLNCRGGDRWWHHLSSLWEFHRAKSYCMVLKAKGNDRRTSSPLPR